MANNKKLNEVNKKTRFSKTNQPTEEAKSNGQIEKRKEFNVALTLRTLAQDYDAAAIAYTSAVALAKMGKPDALIKLLGLAKEPETQNINLNGGVEVQKVFIDAETKKKANNHIDEIINKK